MSTNPHHDTAWRNAERDDRAEKLAHHQKEEQQAVYGTASQVERMHSSTEIRRMDAINEQLGAMERTATIPDVEWSKPKEDVKPFARGTVTDFKGGKLSIGRVLGEGLTGSVTQGTLASGQNDAPVIVKFAKSGYEGLLHGEQATFQAAKVDKIKGGAPLLSVDEIQHPETGQTATVGIARFVPGQTLDRTLAQEERYPNQVVGALASMARTLHDAHRQGVAHLDVKPSNTIVDQQGKTTVVDWGLVHRVGSHEQARMGTLHYMAPEVARGDFTVSGKEDVYSVAMIGARAMNGRYHREYLEDPGIHNKERINEVFEKIAVDRRLPQVKDDLMNSVLSRAAQPDPAKRSTALDLMTDLAAYPEARAQYDQVDRENVVSHLTKRFANQRGSPAQDIDLDATVARGILEDLPENHPRRRALADIAQAAKGYVVGKVGRTAAILSEQKTVQGMDLNDQPAIEIFTPTGPRR